MESPEEASTLFSYHITEVDEETRVEEDAKEAPPELEEGIKSTVDELKEVNLGTKDDPRPTYMSALLTTEEDATYV